MTTTLERVEALKNVAYWSDQEKACSFPHTPEAKAVVECICLACGRMSGYACANHERELIAVMDRNQRGHWIKCLHCQSRNMFTFMPI